jgi:hypothetical protein
MRLNPGTHHAANAKVRNSFNALDIRADGVLSREAVQAVLRQ